MTRKKHIGQWELPSVPLEEIWGWAASIYPMPWFTPYLRKGQRGWAMLPWYIPLCGIKA